LCNGGLAGVRLLLILQSFDWLAAFHLELLQAILSIAVLVYLSAAVFLATCFKYEGNSISKLQILVANYVFE
jgi:hypothetical protein